MLTVIHINNIALKWKHEHREVQMMCKKTKDMVSGKFGFKSLSFYSCAIILSISLMYDNV